MKTLAAVLICCAMARAQEPKERTAGDALKLVTIRKIEVEGSRLPAASVIRLAQIKTGDQVNFMKLHAAVSKAAASGLIKSIEFEYESMPDQDNDVILHLKCTDEKPTVTASIQLPGINEDDVWTWLTHVDPLFTRAMPPTEAAIRLYSNWIGKYMEAHGDPAFEQTFAINAKATSSAGATEPDRLLFQQVKRRGSK